MKRTLVFCVIFLALISIAWAETVAAPKVLAEEQRVWYSISGEEERVMEPNNFKIAFTGITVRTRNTNYNAGLKVRAIEAPPATISPPSNVFVYQYLDVDTIQVSPSDFTTISIRFKVPLSWIAEQQAKQESMRLYRYRDNYKDWGALETRLERTDAEYAYYFAFTQGFGYFTIASKGEGPVKQETAPAPETGPMGPEPAQLAPKEEGEPMWVILVTVALGLIAVGFLGSTFYGLIKENKELQKEKIL